MSQLTVLGKSGAGVLIAVAPGKECATLIAERGVCARRLCWLPKPKRLARSAGSTTATQAKSPPDVAGGTSFRVGRSGGNIDAPRSVLRSCRHVARPRRTARQRFRTMPFTAQPGGRNPRFINALLVPHPRNARRHVVVPPRGEVGSGTSHAQVKSELMRAHRHVTRRGSNETSRPNAEPLCVKRRMAERMHSRWCGVVARWFAGRCQPATAKPVLPGRRVPVGALLKPMFTAPPMGSEAYLLRLRTQRYAACLPHNECRPPPPALRGERDACATGGLRAER